MSRSLDGPLPRRLRLAVGLHRLYCAACRRYGRQLLAMRAALRGFADVTTDARSIPPAMLTAESRERMQRALRDA